MAQQDYTRLDHQPAASYIGHLRELVDEDNRKAEEEASRMFVPGLNEAGYFLDGMSTGVKVLDLRAHANDLYVIAAALEERNVSEPERRELAAWVQEIANRIQAHYAIHLHVQAVRL